MLFSELLDQLRDVNARLDGLDTRILAICRNNAACRRLARLPGVGPIIATALISAIDDVVRKVIRSEATEFRYERGTQPLPKIGPWRDRLDSLLLANELKAPRERLTLIRVFEELRRLGYEGSYDAVRRYARACVPEARSDGRSRLCAAELRAGRSVPV